MIYNHRISLFRKAETRTADGQLSSTRTDLFIRIPASVQYNRSTTGSRSNQVTGRGFIEQPAVARVYTTVDVSEIREDDVLVFHHNKLGDMTFTVLRANDEAGRGRHWRIEVATT